jgi:putative restriction endonuclease
LFDRGVLGISFEHRIQVSRLYSTRSETGRLVYALHGRALDPRRGTPPPSPRHLQWHAEQVFKGAPLAA